MGLFDIFKKKEEKKIYAQKEERKRALSAGKETDKKESSSKKDEANVVTSPVDAKLAESKLAREVLKSPHVTEKATFLGESGQYVFRVEKNANKPMLKRAIEEAYKVEVEKVRILARRDKLVTRRGKKGRSSGYKKAVVILKKGQKIEVV